MASDNKALTSGNSSHSGDDDVIKRLVKARDALDHIVRVANMSNTMSKRVYWIASRAESALNGDEKWRNFDYPRNRVREKESLRKRNNVLIGRLSQFEGVVRAANLALLILDERDGLELRKAIDQLDEGEKSERT
jgi:hypothetical protein